MKESPILRRIIVDLPRRLPGLVLWRNARGFDPRARQEYGLCPGASDLIGIYRGRFVAIEAKRSKGGHVEPAQRMFVALVLRCGGIAGVVRSVDEAASLFGQGSVT